MLVVAKIPTCKLLERRGKQKSTNRVDIYTYIPIYIYISRRDIILPITASHNLVPSAFLLAPPPPHLTPAHPTLPLSSPRGIPSSAVPSLVSVCFHAADDAHLLKYAFADVTISSCPSAGTRMRLPYSSSTIREGWQLWINPKQQQQQQQQQQQRPLPFLPRRRHGSAAAATAGRKKPLTSIRR